MSPTLVLVEPGGPLNVGSVARLCRSYGIEDLRLVAPRCDPLGEEARLMAVKGLPLLQRATVFPTLAAALADCGRVVAATGRPEGEPLPLEDPDDALAWLLAGERALPSALVFGREDRGLSNDELLQAGRLLQIPTPTPHGSLNLSHAVAVVLHDLHRLERRGPTSAQAPAPQAPVGEGPCPRGVLEAMLDDARELLLEVPTPPPPGWPSCGPCCSAVRSVARRWPCCGAWCASCAGRAAALSLPPRSTSFGHRPNVLHP